MATLDDVLTTQKNGVIAINNLNQTLGSLYTVLINAYGNKTTPGISASGVAITGAGRLTRMAVITAGSTAGAIYNYKSYPTTATSGNGATATITVGGDAVTFGVGETVIISSVVPSGYNGTKTTTGGGSNTFQFASATTGAQTSPGKVFRLIPDNAIAPIPNTIGVYEIGSSFADGVYVNLGTGQVIVLNYALS